MPIEKICYLQLLCKMTSVEPVDASLVIGMSNLRFGRRTGQRCVFFGNDNTSLSKRPLENYTM